MFKKTYLTTFLPILFLFTFISCTASKEVSRSQTETGISADYSGVNLDTVKAQQFDTGKMWTFDFPPVDYFREEYNFSPTEEWLSDVRMSALKFGTWCSASFISEDGLIMTNNHCSDFILRDLQHEGEDLRTDGFIAHSLEDERRHPTLHVDVLVNISDVTGEVQKAIAAGTTNEEKAENRKKIISEITNRQSGDGLIHQVVPLYSGGRYSLYSYKRYNDIRLVLIPESELGLYGGDPDNYTYPRYSLDCAFWRAYDEDGKPAKISNYYRWSKNGAQPGEPIFVVGNPGNTIKFKTTEQLKYMRDYSYKYNAYILTQLQNIYEEVIAEYPERRGELVDDLSNYANISKRFSGVLRGLRNPVYMKRKEDFENNFRNQVINNNNLYDKYGNFWEGIIRTREEMRGIAPEYYAYLRTPGASNEYVRIATRLVELAEALKLPEEQRGENFKDISGFIQKIYPEDFDKPVNDKRVRIQTGLLRMSLVDNHPLVQRLIGDRRGIAAADYMLSNSNLSDKDYVINLANRGADAILTSDDPFIIFVRETKDRYAEIQRQISEINLTESLYEEQLGQALFEVYGTTIPPDGTFTLRIGDGLLQSYDYNGTIAPMFTTFYGMYDRYHSHQKQYPWSLPERWVNPPAEFDLSAYYNFISTNDIVGGSSGSAVINKDKEVVGLAFDGNIESNSGYFIYDTTENRMISVASQGMLEVIKNLYRLQRLADEIENGRLSE
jgi:hypothetical protein